MLLVLVTQDAGEFRQLLPVHGWNGITARKRVELSSGLGLGLGCFGLAAAEEPAIAKNTGEANQPSDRPTRRIATITIHTREIGMSHRQPKRMNWS